MIKEVNKNFKPLYLVIWYSSFTIALFYLGPWDWKVTNNLRLMLFLFFSNLSLIIGYYYAIRIYTRKEHSVKKFDLSKLHKPFFYILLIYLIILTVGIIIDYDITLTNFTRKITEAISNPGLAYYNYSQSSSFINKIIIWLQVLFAPIFYCIIPFCIYYFEKINIKEKCLFFIIILLELIKWILKGTNKGIFDLVLLLCVFSMLRVLKKNDFSIKTIFHKNKKLIIFLMFIIIGVVLYFTYNIATRVDMSNQAQSLGSIMNNTKTKSSIFDLLPSFLYTVILIVSSYLCQGYYGLSLCLNLPFQSTYGVGFSNFLSANFNEILGIDVYSRMYAYRAQSLGWSATVNWHTMYTWFANDISYFGVVILMFFIGFIFAYIWLSFVHEDNPLAVPLLGLFSTLFIYISANNQVFNFPTTFMAFFGLIFAWFVYRKYTVIRR